jgi:hypothetical protein
VIRGDPRHRHVAAVAAFVFGSALTAPAQDKTETAPNVVPAAQEDAIARAKKDFEAVKSTRNPALQPRGEMLRMSMPEWSTLSPGISVGTPQKKPAPETKSSNWLVDAMEKTSKARNVRGQGGDRRDQQRASGADSLDRGREAIETPDEQRSRDGRNREDKESKSPAGAVNPLARFLGEWMTPNDYALLKPGLIESLGARGDIKAMMTSNGLGSVGSISPGTAGDPALGSLSSSRPATFLPPPPRENPFLQSLGTTEPGAQIFAAKPNVVTLPPTSQPARPPVSISPPVNPPPTSKIPEFGKPAGDDKYFKQLKRF